MALWVVLLAAVPACDAAASRRAAPKCPPAESGVIARDTQAVIYERVDAGGLPRIYGCVGEHGRSYSLGLAAAYGSSGGGGVEGELLAGLLAVYEESFVHNEPGATPNSSSWVIVMRNLHTGRIVRKVPTGQSEGTRKVGLGKTAALVAKSDGAVAWIVQDPSESCGPLGTTCYEVHAADKRGTRVLAAGADVVPTSLALARSTLYWTQGGKPMSAALN